MHVQAAPHTDQLIRQTRAHHVQLSTMADLKANMLLTMASLVITLSVPQILEGEFTHPLMILVAFCLATIMLAAYASMPKIPFGAKRGAVNPTASTFNILFFGDFTAMSYDDFIEGMEDVMKDAESVYEAQVREVYTLGVFLATKKYRFLRLAYLAFIIGLLLSAASLGLTVYAG